MEPTPDHTAPASAATPEARRQSRILGALLLEEGALRPPQLERALREQDQTGERLGEVVARMGLAPEERVARTLARQLGLPFIPPPLAPEAGAVARIRPAFARKRQVLPLRLEGRVLLVAMRDPLDLASLDDLQFQSGHRVAPVVTTPSAIREGLRVAYAGEVSELAREIRGAAQPGDQVGSERGEGRRTREGRVDAGATGASHQQEEAMARSAPVSRLVDLLLRRAVEAGASDIHVERETDDVVVRERVDGVLRRVAELPVGTRSAVLSRIKILAGMDISVKRRPQDGGFPFPHGGRRLSVRVSTLPVEGGEKAVLRLLDPDAAPGDLGDLGFGDGDLARVRAMLQGGRGVLLTAGPTGSGKSSTLFGCLGELDREGRNVVTLEDPIEYRVPGVNQVQVDPRAGLTFPSALRALLRQDPDVIMVGEIRDRETAEIAMAAAITGHLVLSTIHTVDAPSAVTRLLHMGVPPHMVAGGLAGVVAQRLLRKVCPGCRGRSEGCPRCNRGHRGRTGVFQVLAVTDEIREAVARGGDLGELRRLAEAAGMGSLSQDARRKVAEGTTTPHEIARVLQGDPGDGLPCRRCGGPVSTRARGCPGCGWPREIRCVCGEGLREAWRYCPACLRKTPPAPRL
jgi:type IV pilus assembly protein PilB